MNQKQSYPHTNLAKSASIADSGFVDLSSPGALSQTNPILSTGIPAGQTVTVINVGRNMVGLSPGGYICPDPSQP